MVRDVALTAAEAVVGAYYDVVVVGQQAVDEVGADEAAAAGDEDAVVLALDGAGVEDLAADVGVVDLLLLLALDGSGHGRQAGEVRDTVEMRLGSGKGSGCDE